MALKRDEAKLVRSIKGEAQKGNTAAARQLAKSLVRMRQQQARLQGSKAQLSGVSNNIRVHPIPPPPLPGIGHLPHTHTHAHSSLWPRVAAHNQLRLFGTTITQSSSCEQNIIKGSDADGSADMNLVICRRHRHHQQWLLPWPQLAQQFRWNLLNPSARSLPAAQLLSAFVLAMLWWISVYFCHLRRRWGTVWTLRRCSGICRWLPDPLTIVLPG